MCGRQEVWPVVGGAQLAPWQVLVEGGIGDALLDSYHFAKVTSEQSLVSTSTSETHIMQVSVLYFAHPRAVTGVTEDAGG